MKIAFLGLGAMGSRMARRLVAAGHLVTVWNRSPEAVADLVSNGARRARTPREAAMNAEAVFSMVTDDAAAEAIWVHPEDGALAALASAPGAIALECSTLSVEGIGRIATAAAEAGVAFLDAPVVGSRPHAEAGQLAFLVGGEAATIERVRPLLAVLGGKIHHVGAIGQGIRLKLIVNAFFGIQAVALGELLGVASRAGLDRGTTADLLASLPVSSPSAVGLLRAMASNNHAPQAPVAIIEKDLRYFLNSAEQVHAVTPATAIVHRQFVAALERGLGAQNISGIANLYA